MNKTVYVPVMIVKNESQPERMHKCVCVGVRANERVYVLACVRARVRAGN